MADAKKIALITGITGQVSNLTFIRVISIITNLNKFHWVRIVCLNIFKVLEQVVVIWLSYQYWNAPWQSMVAIVVCTVLCEPILLATGVFVKPGIMKVYTEATNFTYP